MHDKLVSEALSMTQLFKYMSGNPLTICMMANCYISNRNEHDTLLKLFKFYEQQIKKEGDRKINPCI